MKNKHEYLRVGITTGDLNGIGMEVIIKGLLDNRLLTTCTPIVYGSSKTASFHRKALKINDFSFNIIQSADEANPKKPNLINCWNEDVEINLGQPSATTGQYALKSIEAAAKDLAEGRIDVIVTLPIDKKTIQGEGFNFPGHTEYFTQLSNEKESLMLLIAENLRVGVVTGHIPLKEVAERLTKEQILQKLRIMNNSLLRDFGVVKPRIAVLGLNPHAGDNGLLGEEEKNIIIPAVEQGRREGILCFGPYASDGFFGSPALGQFDGVLAMYHDQGLTPFKALSFDAGVNFTAGLPIVRTSPDHGVAYDIAGKGEANENSFRQAVYSACDIFMQRKFYREINANKLQPQQKMERE
ncbi:MAG TPA: 4-hydroxythreonine-4-phosphate dehydrogenase PdxA [Luteibaculaceae bacterium]|nr:4-hydroxythreonine-4-phosphate dehydrogenase PdxA [Luteibaculaceae bacterium]